MQQVQVQRRVPRARTDEPSASGHAATPRDMSVTEKVLAQIETVLAEA